MTRIPSRVQLFWGADAELIELIAKLRIALHSEADVIDGFRCAIDSLSLRADDMDERMAFRIEPVAGNAALYGERSLAFREIEDFQEEVPCGRQIAGANGDVVEFHVKAPFRNGN